MPKGKHVQFAEVVSLERVGMTVTMCVHKWKCGPYGSSETKLPERRQATCSGKRAERLLATPFGGACTLKHGGGHHLRVQLALEDAQVKDGLMGVKSEIKSISRKPPIL